MVIDCGSCEMAEIACSDCVVSVLLGVPGVTPEVDDAHVAAIDVLASSGMVPPLQLVHGGDRGTIQAPRAS